MSTKPNNNGLTTSTTTSSSLRPRAKRLISGLSEGDESAPNSFDSPPRRIASPVPSPFDSRSASPIPPAHPQRTSHASQRFAGNSWGRRAQVGGGQRKGNAAENSSSPSSLAGLWGSSWSTLSGLASDFLGNDVAAASSTAGSVKASSRQQKRPLGTVQHRQRPSSSTTAPGEWGPSAPTSQSASRDIGSGTKAERESALRAQKRKDMLMRQDSSYADALGKFKRRLSDDHESMSAPPSENDDRAALVYLHHVQKDDTLAGITIKYNCSANVLRKANRMWPNDTVQSRQTIVLPVDACGVKGRPVPESGVMNLLGSAGTANAETVDDMQAEEVPTPTPTVKAPSFPNGDNTRDRSISMSTNTTSRRASSSIAAGDEPPWHHDSWVLFPNNSKPTEIARLSRRALGYFPPARRKNSMSFSDLDTPSTSLDLRRNSTANDTHSPAPQRPRRTRKLSNAGNGYFPSYLAGPGGVGTMGSNVRFPGPAQDGLNKVFAKHLPDVAPPRNQVDLYQPDLPMYSDDTPAGSGYATPSLLQNHNAHNTNLNIENVGGAIESWVRRIAYKAMTPTEQKGKARAARASVGQPGRGGGGVGDLIEMTDEFEIGGDDDDEQEEDEEAGRGRTGRTNSVIHLGRGDDGEGGSGADFFGGKVVKARVGTRSQGAKGRKDD
ncbi:hypothetical protein LTR37_014972 [Vermiconidia calcicola]|uniref:Uncharacterized protein n=1 Tax=Vermiconidia calcicola TaxID=1690605 RepID=A0ACC3MRY7_9PEZI|nr:hypothetical protein LTR37_014972 [Vermiconidia calcicola]